MIMKQCSAGHFYDAERYDSCPYCGTNEDKVHTQPNVIPVDNGLEPTVPVNPTTGFGGETIGLDMSKEVRPVVGWLVCIEGPDRGRSYEIHKEKQLPRPLGADGHLHRRRCPPSPATAPMVVTYDANSRSFYCGFMGGRSIVRLNGMPLLSTTQLKRGDIIELGKTKLMFVPFSSDAFDWDWTRE